MLWIVRDLCVLGLMLSVKWLDCFFYDVCLDYDVLMLKSGIDIVGLLIY